MAENWDFIGNEWAVDLLRGQIAKQSLRHAYLFSGPEGIGRRTLALKLAQAANCEQPPAPGDFCGACRACRGFSQMGHTDLHIVELQEGDRQIKVEAVRELSRMLALTPYEARYQVALLVDFDLASEQAANALLKTLEEPAERVLLLLTAESAESLPATIASRCEVLRLRPVEAEELERGLREGYGIVEERARLAARLSGGRPGRALQLARDEEALQQRGEWLAEALQLLDEDHVGRFRYAENASKDRDQLRAILDVWLSLWRDVLMQKGGEDAAMANIDQEADIVRVAAGLKLQAIREFVASIQDTLFELRGNVHPRLAFEALLIALPETSPN